MPIFKKKEPSDAKDREGEEKKKTRKKKKGNLPRSWTKKERISVFIIFGGTILISGILALNAREWKLPNFPRISLPSFSLFKDEVINLGGGSVLPSDRERAENVLDEFKKQTKELSGVYGLYVYDLSKKYTYGVSQNEVFQMASLNKLPVMAAAYLEDENGSLSLSDKYKLKNSDKVTGAGSLYPKVMNSLIESCSNLWVSSPTIPPTK